MIYSGGHSCCAERLWIYLFRLQGISALFPFPGRVMFCACVAIVCERGRCRFGAPSLMIVTVTKSP